MVRGRGLQARRRKAALRNEVAVGVAPRFAAAAPGAGKAFRHKRFAHVLPVDHHESDGAAIAVDAASGIEFDAARLGDEGARSRRCAVAETSWLRWRDASARAPTSLTSARVQPPARY